MHKGTLFLLVLLIVILASSMIFGNYGAFEGLVGSRPPHHKKCVGSDCK